MNTDTTVVPSSKSLEYYGTQLHQMIKSFIFGSKAKQTFSPKKYANLNEHMKHIISKSDKWEHYVVTKEQAKDSKGQLLVGDFVATLIVPIKMSKGDERRMVCPNQLNVHLRNDKIQSRHQSSFLFTK
jgi:hypothetical protein